MASKDLVEKKKEIVAKLSALDLSQEDELREVLKALVNLTAGYYKLLENDDYKLLYDFVMSKTKFIDYETGICTRCWYAVNNFNEMVKCKQCGLPIRRKFSIYLNKPTDLFFCSSQHANANIEYQEKLSRIKKLKLRKLSLASDFPPECIIKYNNEQIEYDDNMNEKLKHFYECHKKNFKCWIDKDPELKAYLFKKSYPLDFTNLNVETRAYWVVHKLQEIPRCKTCGRQLDFQNVKFSKGFKDFCSSECTYKQNRNDKIIHFINSKKCYDKILTSPTTEILFDLDEFSKFKDDNLHAFKCRCKICKTEFENKFDLNFYAREGNKQSYFRCPKCFPFLNQHSSKGERELNQFLHNILPSSKIQVHNRKEIHPYELDIFVKDLKIAFEFNGVYWHSLEYNKHNDINMEYEKTRMCEKLGLKIVHIWEDDWKEKQDEVKDMIKTVLFDKEAILALSKKNNDGFIIIDRSIFNKSSLPVNLVVDEVIEPTLTSRHHVKTEKIFHTWNCGYFKCHLIPASM